MITVVLLVIIGFLSVYIYTNILDPPDIHPVMLRCQSNCSRTRAQGQTVVYSDRSVSRVSKLKIKGKLLLTRDSIIKAFSSETPVIGISDKEWIDNSQFLKEMQDLAKKLGSVDIVGLVCSSEMSIESQKRLLLIELACIIAEIPVLYLPKDCEQVISTLGLSLVFADYNCTRNVVLFTDEFKNFPVKKTGLLPLNTFAVVYNGNQASVFSVENIESAISGILNRLFKDSFTFHAENSPVLLQKVFNLAMICSKSRLMLGSGNSVDFVLSDYSLIESRLLSINQNSLVKNFKMNLLAKGKIRKNTIFDAISRVNSPLKLVILPFTDSIEIQKINEFRAFYGCDVLFVLLTDLVAGPVTMTLAGEYSYPFGLSAGPPVGSNQVILCNHLNFRVDDTPNPRGLVHVCGPCVSKHKLTDSGTLKQLNSVFTPIGLVAQVFANGVFHVTASAD